MKTGKIKKLDANFGRDIRSVPIPAESGLAARLGKIVNSKRQTRKGKWE